MFKNQFEDFFAEKFLKAKARGTQHVSLLVSKENIIGSIRMGTGPRMETAGS